MHPVDPSKEHVAGSAGRTAIGLDCALKTCQYISELLSVLTLVRQESISKEIFLQKMKERDWHQTIEQFLIAYSTEQNLCRKQHWGGDANTESCND